MKKFIAKFREFITSKKGIILLIAVLFISGYGIWKYNSSSTKTQTYQTATVEKGTLITSVTSSGTVSSSNNVAVTSQASGVISTIYVQNGDSVYQGQKIAEITLDQTSVQKQAAAYSSYLSAVNAQKNAQTAKLSADSAMWQAQQNVLTTQNSKDLKDAGDSNPSTKTTYTDLEKQAIDSSMVEANKSFAAAEQKYKDADTAVAAANAQLNSAWLSYQQLSNVIVAPITGTVSNLSITEGSVLAETNSGSGSTNTSNTIGTVTLPNGSLQASVSLSEIDVTKVKEEQKVTMTLDAFPEKTFTGVLSSVNTNGSVSSGVTTYPAIITFDTSDSAIYPNMAVSGTIITQAKTDVLLIPSSAVETIDGVSTVQVMENGTPISKTVQIGLSNDSQTEITEGLNEGDQIVIGSGSSEAIRATQQGTTPFGNTFGPGRGGFGGGGGGNVVRFRGGGG